MAEARYLGHACVLLGEGPHRLILDPYLTGNPQAAAAPEAIDVQHILVSHGHHDHLGDAIPIALRTGATIIATAELAGYCEARGARTHAMHIGGEHDFAFGRVKLTIAQHGGGGPEPGSYTGPPVGFLITLGGKIIYHAGDTGLFRDMRLIGEMNPIELAFLPIGGNYTMGIEDAVCAAELLRPRRLVPIHYGTWPVIAADPQAFAARVRDAQVIVLRPGETLDF